MKLAIAVMLTAGCTRPASSDIGPSGNDVVTARGARDAGTTPGKTLSMDCSTTKKRLAARDFVGWRGIPANCDAADLFGSPPADLASRPRRNLGDEFVPAQLWLLDLPGYYRPIASLVDGRLVLFDGMNPELAGPFAALRDDLGTPAGRLDWERGTLTISGGEWVYPERGITLFVDPDAANTALHVAVYHATTLDVYRRTLRPHLGKRLLPKR